MSSQRQDVAVCGFIHSGVDWLEKIIRYITHQSQSINQSETNIHSYVNKLPTSFPEGWFSTGNKTVFILRNPKDIVSASFAIEGGHESRFNSYLEEFVSIRSHDSGAISWFDHTLLWGDVLKTLPKDMVLLVYFEDLVHNLRDELCKICAFLGVHRSSHTIDEWSENLHNQEIVQTDGPVKKRRKSENGTLTTNTADIYECGMWKRLFMVGQSEAFDTVMKNKMASSAISIDRYF